MRGLRCALCGAFVCRACSRVVRPSARIRVCGSCYQHREVSCPSGEWFYRELKTKFHDVTPSPSSSDSSLDVNMEVREFIERLTENIVSGSVDDVTVEPLSSHPLYEALCTEFHPKVEEALTRLSQALQLAITDLAQSCKMTESPSEVHVQLKRLVTGLRSRALLLPILEMDSFLDDDEANSPGATSPSLISLDFSRRTYEDLLATAIINKVVEGAQCELMEKHLQTPVSPHAPLNFISSVQIGVGDYEDQPEKKVPVEKTLTVTMQSEEENDDSCWSPSNSEDDSEGQSSTQGHVKISGANRGQSASSEMQRFLSGLKYSHRVPFPELGADIIEGSVQESLLEEMARTTLYLVNSDSHSSLSSASWEENWLFQRRRLRLAPANPRSKTPQAAADTRVPMLVPNPRAEDSHVRAKIGEVDADQLSSDLSDYESYMSREESDEEGNSLDSHGRHYGLGLGHLLGPDLIEATNQELGATLIIGQGAESSEFDQQEGEYTEAYASIGQRSLTSLTEAMQASLLPDSSSSSQVPDILESAQINKPVPAVRMLHKSESEPEDRLATPPRPGTIAEREHRKWQQARPMLNNPYSEENIARRLGRRQRGGRLRDDGPSSLPLLSSAQDSNLRPPSDQPLRINCSGQIADFSQYGRDYYIKGIPGATKMENASITTSPRSSISSPPATDEITTMGSTQSSAGDDLQEEDQVKMPSVRELAKQFAPPLLVQQVSRNSNSRHKSARSSAADYNKERNVIIVETSSKEKIPPVHSLTARSLSKEFRAGLRGESLPANKSVPNAAEDEGNDPAKQTENHRANLEFWRSLDPPTPAPRTRNK